MVLPPLWPSRLTWEHYQVVLERAAMLRALVNSLGVGAITTALALALGVSAAYGLARLLSRARARCCSR
jgi:multiple sugar transport system permease protein